MKPMVKPASLLLFGAMAFLAGCKATPPGKWETLTITKIKHSITVGGKNDKNPVPDKPANVESGRIAFSHYCVACHGFDGQNTGVPFADTMSPPVPLLNSRQVQTYTDGQLHWIMENGVSPSGMPASRGILTETELWSIVVYLRHLPPAGTLGEPPMYSGDDSSQKCPPGSSSEASHGR
jgi:mono/diheme cytochrome c family protein